MKLRDLEGVNLSTANPSLWEDLRMVLEPGLLSVAHSSLLKKYKNKPPNPPHPQLREVGDKGHRKLDSSPSFGTSLPHTKT